MKTYLIDTIIKSNDNKIIKNIKGKKRKRIFEYDMIRH